MSTTYKDAPAVREIATQLIHEHHPHLTNASIRYVFRSEAQSKGGKLVLGTARKITGLNAYLFALALGTDPEDFFVIEIARDTWEVLNLKQQHALVDHELHHCALDDEGKLLIVPHDIEEFCAIVRKHGLWEPTLELFAAQINEAVARAQEIALTDHSLLHRSSNGGGMSYAAQSSQPAHNGGRHDH